MARRITDQGLQDSLDATFNVGGTGTPGGAFDPVDAMGVSNFGTLLAGTTSIASAGSKLVKAFDAAPTRNNLTVTCVATFGTGEANFQITTVTLHNDGAAVNTGVYGGVDAQSLTKTSDFSLKITMNVTYANG